MLDVKKLLCKILKCTYKTGSDNGWEYKMYADGTYDAWKRDTSNIARTSQVGNLYVSVDPITVNLPSFNSGTTYELGGLANGQELVVLETIPSAGTYFTYRLAQGSSRTAQSRTVRFFLHGHWV